MAAMASAAGASSSTLLSLTDDKRELVDEARAHELIKAALGERDPASITRVRLSNKSYSAEAATVIGETLKKMTSVTEVDFSDIIAGRPKAVGLKVLAAVCGGVADRQDLSYVDLNENAMGLDGVEACRAAIEGKKQLSSLFMCNDGLSEAAMEAVRDMLLASTPTALRTLHFSKNMSGDGGAKALAQAFAECPAASSGLLERLDLADNTFGEDGGRLLAQALASQPALTCVNLSECDLEDEGALAVAEALSNTAPAIRELDFSGNDLTEEGADAVAACVAKKPRLEYLGMEDNGIGSAGAKAVARALAHTPAIRSVQLSCNEMGTTGALAVARGLRDKKDLESLGLNGNMVSEEGLSRLRRILESSGKLEALGDMDDNDPDGEEDDDNEDESQEDSGGDVEDGGGDDAPAPKHDKDDGDVDELSAALGAVHV